MNKSQVTSLLALGLTVTGYFWPPGTTGSLILNSGLFALSGALTNWLAVHMLFERVPGLYGSGVVPARFEEFRAGIKELIMTQFFSEENLQRFFRRLEEEAEDREDDGPQARSGPLDRLVERVDLNGAFESLVDAIMQSSFGSMLSMMGGRKSVESLREPFIKRMKGFLSGLGRDARVMAELRKSSSEVLLDRVELIVEQRLNELTPELVKRIVQDMIREHLGWLVVWGGVFGGLIGFVSTVLLRLTG